MRNETGSSASLAFGKADDRWAQYGLREYPVLFNRDSSGYKAVTRNGGLVTIVSDNYMLLPNEVAVGVADAEAERCGLVPFNEFKGEWLARMNDHVVYSKGETRVHALYAINKPYKVGKDQMHLGVGVHNGIDGHFGFTAGIFTFRKACANMVFAGMPRYEQTFDQRSTIEYINKAHTKGLDPALPKLKEAILRMMDRAGEIIDAYEEMTRRQVSLELIKRIRASRLPKKVWPEEIQVGEDKISAPDMTQWDFYNAITQKVWHNPDMELRSKIELYGTLHRIMPLQTRRQHQIADGRMDLLKAGINVAHFSTHRG